MITAYVWCWLVAEDDLSSTTNQQQNKDYLIIIINYPFQSNNVVKLMLSEMKLRIIINFVIAINLRQKYLWKQLLQFDPWLGYNIIFIRIHAS